MVRVESIKAHHKRGVAAIWLLHLENRDFCIGTKRNGRFFKSLGARSSDIGLHDRSNSAREMRGCQASSYRCERYVRITCIILSNADNRREPYE
jgi:hypothetical protein